MKEIPRLFIVLPCYNEEEILQNTVKELSVKLDNLIFKEIISRNSKLLLVDDGSKDRTWEIIEKLHKESLFVNGLQLSRNKGHQNALLAGLFHSKDLCDVTISMDADLQDDMDVIDVMLKKYELGADIVYGVRSDRSTDSWFKRNSAQAYYKILEFLSGEIVYNHADFRLMSKKALEGLSKFREVNLFLRGIVPMVGYKADTVSYSRKKRLAGESKYPLKKMINFAVDGITSLSTKPIRCIMLLGLIVFSIGIIMSLYTLIVYLAGATVHGWASIMISIWAIGGLQLLSIGIIGEYIGKIYLETKNRPRYIIKTTLGE